MGEAVDTRVGNPEQKRRSESFELKTETEKESHICKWAGGSILNVHSSNKGRREERSSRREKGTKSFFSLQKQFHSLSKNKKSHTRFCCVAFRA